jgi:hypothetical protein
VIFRVYVNLLEGNGNYIIGLNGDLW